MTEEELAEALKGQQPGNPRYAMDEAIHPEQIAAYRRMTPGEKFVQVVQMCHMGISLTIAGLRMRHPDWTHDHLLREAQRISTYGVG